ncbi:MAG: hypothetical protein IPM20_03025 [Gammaproteobacteria bacterium]|nr:hypothetical protein [Gammaproteobacteria bacterium]
MAKRYPDAFSEGSLRWAIHNAERNGLARSGAIVRIGRRVLIDEELFLRWIDEQQKQLAV